jgi:hypothetical protein
MLTKTKAKELKQSVLCTDEQLHTFYELRHNPYSFAGHYGIKRQYARILHSLVYETHKTYCVFGVTTHVARDILFEIKDNYLMLPNWMVPPIQQDRVGSVFFDNGSKMMALTADGISTRGLSFQYAIIDKNALGDPSRHRINEKSLLDFQHLLHHYNMMMPNLKIFEVDLDDDQFA